MQGSLTPGTSMADEEHAPRGDAAPDAADDRRAQSAPEGPGSSPADERVVRGRLVRPGPGAGSPPPEAVGRTPEAEEAPAAEHPPSDDLKQANGSPTWFTVGLALLLLGMVVYLYGLYATANAVLGGADSPEQRVALFGLRWLVGSIGLALAAVGAIMAIVFLFIPSRMEPVVTADSLQYRALVGNARSSLKLARILAWGGLGLAVLGLLLAILVFQQTVDEGRLWRLSLGGVGYRIHFVGYLFMAVGGLLFLTMAPRLGPLATVVAVADAHRRPTHGRGGVAHGYEGRLEADDGLPEASTQSVPHPDDHGVEGTHAGWR